MNRRQLLQRLSIIPVLGLLTGPKQSRPDYLTIQHSPLAGFQYHQGERLWPRLREGQTLQLNREASNPYDRQAVRVDWRGRKLGYIPARQNHAIAQMLDRGQRLHCRISRLQQAQSPWDRIELEIRIDNNAVVRL